MKFTKEDMEYLSGAKFSIWYKLRLSNNPLFSRSEFILDITKHKRILHIGCCDHIPLILDKVKKKTWLHGLLTENCSFVAGIDIDTEAIQYVNNNIPIHGECMGGNTDIVSKNKMNPYNIYYADITKMIPKELQNEKFDYAILGEVIEHVNDPVSFLRAVKENLKNNVEKIIISVPYAFGVRQMFNGFLKRENINSDHRYWFTPYTIAKVCVEAGIYPEELLFCGNPPKILRILRKMKKILHLHDLSCFSTLSNVLVVIASVK